MNTKKYFEIAFIVIVIAVLATNSVSATPQMPERSHNDLDIQAQSSTSFVVDHTHTNLAAIPDVWIDQAQSDLHIAYNHTSHGSQLITGMNALEQYPDFGSKYDWVNSSTGSSDSLSLDDYGIPGESDLSQGDKDSDGDGIADWAEDTYDFLVDTNNYHINVIMWSWCNIAGHDITRYLNSMEWLIAQFGEGGTHARAAQYPVKFVFMTAHANGGGEGDSSDVPNEQIRAHVAANNRILFDFSDIENYDPDENYYLDKLLQDDLDYDSDNNGSRDANWALEYIIRYDDSELDRLTTGNNVSGYSGAGSCAHSDGGTDDGKRLNCVLKGRAAWYLFARLAGWDGGSSTPTVSSIVRADPNPTTAASVDFTVTFSESVTGVDATDFTLTTMGISGASISGVAGSGTTRTVSVSTGSGNGTIRLDLVDVDSIQNGSGIPLGGSGMGNGDYSAGEAYTIPPEHDEFGSAKTISTFGVADETPTFGATVANDDPTVDDCNLGQGQATVWYKYTPGSDSAISLDTFGADYDTFIAVWTVEQGSLSPVACNDDANDTGQSALAIQVQENTVYYIEIGQP